MPTLVVGLLLCCRWHQNLWRWRRMGEWWLHHFLLRLRLPFRNSFHFTRFDPFYFTAVFPNKRNDFKQKKRTLLFPLSHRQATATKSHCYCITRLLFIRADVIVGSGTGVVPPRWQVKRAQSILHRRQASSDVHWRSQIASDTRILYLMQVMPFIISTNKKHNVINYEDGEYFVYFFAHSTDTIQSVSYALAYYRAVFCLDGCLKLT